MPAMKHIATKAEVINKGLIYLQLHVAKKQPSLVGSPDLAPSDYHLFRSLSNGLKDREFEHEDKLKRYL